MMARWQWQLRQLGRCVRLPWRIALLLAAAAGLLAWQGLLPLLDRQARQRVDLDEHRAVQAELAAGVQQATPAEQLAEFYAFFPDAEAVPETLSRLFAAAARENLMLPQGEYKLTRETNGRLTRYEITLPVKGSYPGVRRFIAAALQETPALSLLGVAFSRMAAADIGIDAQIRFALYVREVAAP